MKFWVASPLSDSLELWEAFWFELNRKGLKWTTHEVFSWEWVWLVMEKWICWHELGLARRRIFAYPCGVWNRYRFNVQRHIEHVELETSETSPMNFQGGLGFSCGLRLWASSDYIMVMFQGRINVVSYCPEFLQRIVVDQIRNGQVRRLPCA